MAETWLGPYLQVWQQMQGAISPGRLAKAVKDAHDLLGADGPPAFAMFAASRPDLRPEWFGPNCRHWAAKATAPLVSPTGTLTPEGRKAYGGLG